MLRNAKCQRNICRARLHHYPCWWIFVLMLHAQDSFACLVFRAALRISFTSFGVCVCDFLCSFRHEKYPMSTIYLLESLVVASFILQLHIFRHRFRTILSCMLFFFYIVCVCICCKHFSCCLFYLLLFQLHLF